ncbi:MAG: Bbp16 family capsid cement protein [Candidatus Thermoplasmatota archaeon]|jgi:hypothetical protein
MQDKQLIFSDAQDIGLTQQSVLSTYSVDLGAVGTVPGLGGQPLADLMRGNRPRIVAQIVEAVVGTVSTITVEVVCAENAALTTNLRVLDTSLAIAEATLVAGYQFHIDITTKMTAAERYLGLRYTIGTATTTAGTITAWLELNPSDAYPLGG